MDVFIPAGGRLSLRGRGSEAQGVSLFDGFSSCVCVLPASSATWHREHVKKEKEEKQISARLVWHASVEVSDLAHT